MQNRPKAAFSPALPTIPAAIYTATTSEEPEVPLFFRKPSVLLRTKGICHMLMMVGASAYYQQENKGGILPQE